MPLPIVTFTDPRLSQPIQQAPWLTGIQTGVGLAGQLEQMRQRAQMAPLQRQLTAAQAAEAAARPELYQAQTREALAHMPLYAAQAKQALATAAKEQALAKSPFGGKILPGAAGRAQGLQILGDTYGTDSPIYQRAVKDYDSDMKLKLSRAQYFSANIILKNLPDTVKLQKMENYYNEQAERKRQGLPPQTFKQWYMQPAAQADRVAPQVGVTAHPAISAPATTPQVTQTPVTSTTPTPAEQATAGTQQVTSVQPRTAQPLSPQMTAQGVTQPQPAAQPMATAQAGLVQEPFAQEARQVGVGISTKTIPTFVQQKMAYVANIEKTLDQMPEEAITAYSQNPVKLANDYRKSLDGEITPDYKNYLKFVNNAKFLSTQARQFYGDSIDPKMLKRLDDMTNPISWRTNPKAALITYHATKDLLRREMGTYVDESSDPQFFEKQRESKVLRGMTPHGTQPAPKKVSVTPAGTIKASDGKSYSREELLRIAQGGR